MCYVTLGEAVEKIIENVLDDKGAPDFSDEIHELQTDAKIAKDDIDGLKGKVASLERDLLKLTDIHDENVKVINLLAATVKEQQKMLEILSDVAQGKKRLRRSWWD